MPYREPSPVIRSPARVVWGPFGFGGPSIVAGLALFVLGVITIGDRLETQTIACHADRCEVATAWFGRERHVVVDSPVDVSVETVSCPAKPDDERRCGIVVLSGPASTIRLIPTRPAEARRVADLLRRGLSAPSDSVPITLHKLQRDIVAFASVELLVALLLIGSGIWRRSRFQICIDGERGRITLRRRVLNLPLGSRDFEVDVVRDARVEWRNNTGRLVLDTDRGLVPLDEKSRPGWTVHRRAADALRKVFDCPPRAKEVQAQLDRAANEARGRRLEMGVVRALAVGLFGGAIVAAALLPFVPSDWSERSISVLLACGAIIGAYAALSARRQA